MMHGRGDAKVFDLRFGESLINTVDGTTRHTRLAEGFDPVLAGAFGHNRANYFIQASTVLRTQGRSPEIWMRCQILSACHF